MENKGIYMKKFDILYNCICLDNSSNEIWFDKSTIFTKKLLIVDISCDYTKPNNPINIYKEPTTFENPVYKYNNYVDIIAINNLPSLLPKWLYETTEARRRPDPIMKSDMTVLNLV